MTARGVALVRLVTARGDVEVPASADLHLLRGRLGVGDQAFVCTLRLIAGIGWHDG